MGKKYRRLRTLTKRNLQRNPLPPDAPLHEVIHRDLFAHGDAVFSYWCETLIKDIQDHERNRIEALPTRYQRILTNST